MICPSQPALLSAVWYTGDMCGAGMLISRPGHHTISWPVSPDRSISCISYPTISYLLSRLSPAWLQPRLSRLSSPEPLSSLVPAIDLADILPRCCNHNVGGNIERKVTNGHFYYCLNLCYKIWLFDEYLKSPCSPSLLSQCQIHILISSQLSPQQTEYWSVWFWYITSLFYLLSRYLHSMDHSSVIYKFFCSYERKYWSSFISHFSIFTQCGAAVGRY